MKEIFEKEEEVYDEVEKKNVKRFRELVDKDKAQATHKHICYHDEPFPRPCKRIKL